MKALSKVRIEWSTRFAYAIGLIATGGNLSKDNHHINFTSKEKRMVILFKKCLGIKNKKYFTVQFGDKFFFGFLIALGLTPAKSKTIKDLRIPEKYFMDFLRGCIDGDGNIHVFNHPESRYLQLSVRLFPASYNFLSWIQEKIRNHVKIYGGKISLGNRVFILSYAKSDSEKLLRSVYYKEKIPRLYRKYMAARPFLGTIFRKMRMLNFLPDY